MPNQVQQLMANLEHSDLPGISATVNTLLTRLEPASAVRTFRKSTPA